MTKRRAKKQFETLARREQVAYLRARGLQAMQILAELAGTTEKPGPFPKAILKTVYNDIEYIQAHAGEYIATKFLPQLGDHFQNAVANLEMVRQEAWRRYQEGETETQEIDTPDGHTSKHIHREGGAEWLRLAGMASLAILKLGQQGPVTKVATQVMADYNRLKDLEKKGMIIVAPVQPGQ